VIAFLLPSSFFFFLKRKRGTGRNPQEQEEEYTNQADTNQRTSYVEISYRLNSSSARVGIPFFIFSLLLY